MKNKNEQARSITLPTVTVGAVERAIRELESSRAKRLDKVLATAETIILLGAQDGTKFQLFNGLFKAIEGEPALMKALITHVMGRVPHRLAKKPDGNYVGKLDPSLVMGPEQLAAAQATRAAANATTQAKLSAQRADNKAKLAEYPVLVARVAELEATGDVASAEKLAAATNRISALERALKSATEAANAACARAQAAETKAARMAADHDELRSAHAALTADYSSLQSALVALRRDYAVLQGRLVELRHAA